eukprot:scaffold368_cov258-Pinguiococcus_pyrenoidosus.AAC.13
MDRVQHEDPGAAVLRSSPATAALPHRHSCPRDLFDHDSGRANQIEVDRQRIAAERQQGSLRIAALDRVLRALEAQKQKKPSGKADLLAVTGTDRQLPEQGRDRSPTLQALAHGRCVRHDDADATVAAQGLTGERVIADKLHKHNPGELCRPGMPRTDHREERWDGTLCRHHPHVHVFFVFDQLAVVRRCHAGGPTRRGTAGHREDVAGVIILVVAVFHSEGSREDKEAPHRRVSRQDCHELGRTDRNVLAIVTETGEKRLGQAVKQALRDDGETRVSSQLQQQIQRRVQHIRIRPLDHDREASGNLRRQRFVDLPRILQRRDEHNEKQVGKLIRRLGLEDSTAHARNVVPRLRGGLEARRRPALDVVRDADELQDSMEELEQRRRRHTGAAVKGGAADPSARAAVARLLGDQLLQSSEVHAFQALYQSLENHFLGGVIAVEIQLLATDRLRQRRGKADRLLEQEPATDSSAPDHFRNAQDLAHGRPGVIEKVPRREARVATLGSRSLDADGHESVHEPDG